MSGLTKKQIRFVQEYLIDLNATQAAIRAGYSENTAGSIGFENLRKPDIAEAIQEAQDERAKGRQWDAQKVLERLEQTADLDISDIINDDWSVKPLSQWPMIWRQSLSGLDILKSITTAGEDVSIESIVKKMKWPEKLKTLELIGRHVNVKAFGNVDPEDDREVPPLNITFQTRDAVSDIKVTNGPDSK